MLLEALSISNDVITNSIYERNAINAGLPMMTGTLLHSDFVNGDEIEVNFETGEILHVLTNDKYVVQPFAKVQMEIFQRGGLLKN